MDQSGPLRPPDDETLPAPDATDPDSPRIYAAAVRKPEPENSRRDFLRRLAGGTGLAALARLLSGCESSEFGIDADEERQMCRCHTVCACDTEDDENEYGTDWTREGGEICVCDLVCTCNTVCTCNSMGCGSDGGGGGGGGGHYWYPC